MILATFTFLTFTLVIVVRYSSLFLPKIIQNFYFHHHSCHTIYRRRRSELVLNVITVHNYGTTGDDESDTDSLQEQHTLLVEETKFTDNTRPVRLTSIQHEPFTVPSKEQVSKLFYCAN